MATSGEKWGRRKEKERRKWSQSNVNAYHTSKKEVRKEGSGVKVMRLHVIRRTKEIISEMWKCVGGGISYFSAAAYLII